MALETTELWEDGIGPELRESRHPTANGRQSPGATPS